MAEYSRLASGQVVSTGINNIVPLPFIPNYIEISNATAAQAAAGVTRAWWETDMGQGAAFRNLYGTGEQYIDVIGGSIGSTGALVDGTGFSTFQAGISLQFGPLQGHNLGDITDFSIAKSVSPTTITTVGTDHNLQSGDVIVFQNLLQTATTGMQQIASIMFTVTRLTANTFTIDWNTNGSNYTAFNTATSTGNVGTYKKVLFPYLYAPGVSVITSIDNGPTTTISTTDAHNMVVGQEVAIRIPTIKGAPTVWGPTQFNSLPNSTIPGSPIYGFVVSVTDYNTVVVNINSSNFTAFNVNLPMVNVPGATPAQLVAVGDVNTGGVQISAGSALYPPPYVVPIGTSRVNTINGPAIQGAFFNNTSMGFIIGSGVVGTEGDVLFWRAYMHDMNT